MQWYNNIFELIDMRSFSNLWFWIVLAVVWSSASHWVLGVPFDLVQRARRRGGQAMEDLEALVRVNINRQLYIREIAGLWVTGGVALLLSTTAVLGFVYGIEFCQAVFLLALPMTLVGALRQSLAVRLAATGAEGAVLISRLVRHRLHLQLIGMVSIFVTALWGMWQNMNVSVLGG